jgi:hypothetical protein
MASQLDKKSSTDIIHAPFCNLLKEHGVFQPA